MGQRVWGGGGGLEADPLLLPPWCTRTKQICQSFSVHFFSLFFSLNIFRGISFIASYLFHIISPPPSGYPLSFSFSLFIVMYSSFHRKLVWFYQCV